MQSAPLHGMHPIYQHPHILAAHHQHQQHLQQQQQQQQQLMWHARSYESGIGIYSQMNYMLDPHHYACATANATSGGGCPYQIYGHTKNFTNDTNRTNGQNMATLKPGSALTRPSRHQPCYRTCSTDFYLGQNGNTPYNGTYGYCGVGNSNKWRSESDIVNMDKDETEHCESNGHKLDYSEQDDQTDSRNTSPLAPSTPSQRLTKDNHYHTKHSPAKCTKSHDIQVSKPHPLQSLPPKKSASIESFFQLDPNQTKNDEIYDKIKSGDEIYITQKKRIDDHLRSVAEKDHRREQFLLRNSNFANYCQSESSYQQIPRIYERPSRNTERKTSHIRRERSLYDYRGSNGKDKFESDLESIYGYLKPRKHRGHGLKTVAK